jgi:tetratricopeptide (TPR) repeat protein
VLARGAVEGRLFHRGAVSALLPEDERDGLPGRLLRLARKAFVRPDEALFPGDDAFRFVHALVRDAAYEAAPKELRAELHEGFATWLEARAPDQDEVIGFHLEQSYRCRTALGEPTDGVQTRAGEHLAAAGERAFKRGDFRGAANLLGRAHELLSSRARGPELVSRLAEAFIEGGRLEEARSLLEDSIAEARRAGAEAPALRHEIELDLLSIQLQSDWSADEALALVERAMPILEAADDSLGLYRAWDAIRTVGWMRGRLKDAIAAAGNALYYAEQVGDANLIANALTGRLAPTWFGDTPLSVIIPEHIRQLEWARAVGQRALEGSMLWVMGRIHFEQGRPDEGAPLMEEGLAIVDSMGLVIHASGLRSQFSPADLACHPQRVEENVRASYELLKSLNETGFLSTQAAALASLLARRNELDEAERLTHESELLGSGDDVTTQAGWRSARARVLGRRGSFPEAEALANEALAIAASSEYTAVHAEAHLALADVLCHAGRTSEAVAATEEALKIFEQKEMTAAADAIREELTALQSAAGSPSQ